MKKLSIAIITYNQKAFIEKTINSILNQIPLTPEYEVIIGDDGSTDGTREILKSFENRYYSNIKILLNDKNLGAVNNYYNVLSYCTGSIVMQCGGDDYWLDGKVEMQLGLFLEKSNVGMIYTKSLMVDCSGKSIGCYGGPHTDFYKLIESNCVPAPTVAFRRKLYQEYVNQISPKERRWKMEDYPFWLWLSYNSKIEFVSTPYAAYRMLPESVSHSEDIRKLLAFKYSVCEIKHFYLQKKGLPSNLDVAKKEVLLKFLKSKLKQKKYKDVAVSIFDSELNWSAKAGLTILSGLRIVLHVLFHRPRIMK